MGYANDASPNQVTGLPEGTVDLLGQRDDPVHGATGTAAVLTWQNLSTTVGNGGLIISPAGRPSNDMPREAGLVIERRDGAGGWEEVAPIHPRATFTDFYFTDAELGRTGSSLEVRLRWLDIHALDYVAFVEHASPDLWSSSVAIADTAEIAYSGGVRSELEVQDGAFAVLGPGQKLTIGYPYATPEPGDMRTLVFATHGYYIMPEEQRASGGETQHSIIQFASQNQPNPFNPSTEIRFALNRGAEVSLAIYSVTGRTVRILHEGPLASGNHEFVWDGLLTNGESAASGQYFYRLVAGGETRAGKMLMLK